MVCSPRRQLPNDDHLLSAQVHRRIHLIFKLVLSLFKLPRLQYFRTFILDTIHLGSVLIPHLSAATEIENIYDAMHVRGRKLHGGIAVTPAYKIHCTSNITLIHYNRARRKNLRLQLIHKSCVCNIGSPKNIKPSVNFRVQLASHLQ